MTRRAMTFNGTCPDTSRANVPTTHHRFANAGTFVLILPTAYRPVPGGASTKSCIRSMALAMRPCIDNEPRRWDLRQAIFHSTTVVPMTPVSS